MCLERVNLFAVPRWDQWVKSILFNSSTIFHRSDSHTLVHVGEFDSTATTKIHFVNLWTEVLREQRHVGWMRPNRLSKIRSTAVALRDVGCEFVNAQTFEVVEQSRKILGQLNAWLDW